MHIVIFVGACIRDVFFKGFIIRDGERKYLLKVIDTSGKYDQLC